MIPLGGLIDALKTAWAHGGKPTHILVGAQQAAAIRAHVDFQGRDRRRIKREVNKAMRKARA